MSDDVRQGIASEVRAELARQKKTQYDLAKVLGLPQPAVSLRLTGRRPFKAEELVAVAGFLGVPVAQFMPVAA